MILIGFPSTPPAWFSSSTASMMPSWELCPKVAVGPVIEAYSPMTTSLAESAEPPDFLHPPANPARARPAASAQQVMVVRITGLRKQRTCVEKRTDLPRAQCSSGVGVWQASSGPSLLAFRGRSATFRSEERRVGKG